MKKHILNLVFFMVWLGVIFTFSSQPGVSTPFEPLLDKILHSGAHMAEFFVLAYLWFQIIRSRAKSNTAIVISIVLMVFAIAWLDETYQTTVPGRQFDLLDVGFDLLGGVVFLALNKYYG